MLWSWSSARASVQRTGQSRHEETRCNQCRSAMLLSPTATHSRQFLLLLQMSVSVLSVGVARLGERRVSLAPIHPSVGAKGNKCGEAIGSLAFQGLKPVPAK